MNRMKAFFNELDGKGKVFSALFGALTLFAILGVVAPGWYEQMPEYTEWICGDTTWSAYNKQADMSIVQSALIGVPVFFLLFACVYVLWKRTMAGISQTAGAVLATTYALILCMFFRGDAKAGEWLILWGCLFAGYFYLGHIRRTEEFGRIVTGAVLVMLAATAGVMFLNGASPFAGNIWDSGYRLVTAAGAVVFALLVLLKKAGKCADMLLELQFVLPLAWIGLIPFRYRYEKDGALYELFGSGRWKWACVFACLLCLGICIWERKKRGRTLFFTTYVMTAVIRVFSQPEGILNIDYFHNGEITMPMQQLMSYGKLPYKDMIPIHGMCDYYYGLIDYLFFDGSYLSLNAAKTVGDVLAAVVLAVVVYFFADRKLQGLVIVYLFMPFMVLSAGMRYWFLFAMFFVLFSKRIRKGMESLYAWVWLSILAIAWNASIGGAGALAFLPVILYRLKRDFPSQWKELCCSKEKKKRNLTWAAWGVLLAAGIAFVPLFLQIVGYLKENTGTTLYVNGMEMISDVTKAAEYLVPGVVNAQGDFFVNTFAFLIPLAVAFVLLFCREKIGAGEVFVTYLLAFWVLANYSFVRYDDGLRSKVLGIFFLLLTAVTLVYRWRAAVPGDEKAKASALYAAMIGGAILLAQVDPFVTSQNLVLVKEVPEYIETTIMGQEVEDPVVHVTGEIVSIPKLGTGFIQGNTLVSLQNVQTVVEAAKQNGQTVFDITNAVANAVLLDMPLYLPYSSAYNISNAAMQEKAIELLAEELPDVILAAPEIRFDDAPFSFRSVTLYRYLMQQDYVPYKYENVIYLVRGENPLPLAEQNMEAFAQLMHKKDLAYLPAVWGSNAANVEKSLTEISVAAKIEDTESGFCVVFDTPITGEEIAMIGITGLEATESAEETRVTMTMPSSIASEGEAEFAFACMGNEYLIPVCCSPYFTQEESIAYLEFTSQTSEVLSAENVKISYYSW